MVWGKTCIRVDVVIIILILIFSGSFIIIPQNQLSFDAQASSSSMVNTWADFDKGSLTNLTIYDNDYKAKLGFQQIESAVWKELQITHRPSERAGHKMTTIYGTEKVLLYGGGSKDTWVYHHDKHYWEQKYPTNSPTTTGGFSMAPIGGTDKVILFGGGKATDSYDETWIYDYSENTWEMKTPSNFPGERYTHRMAPIYGTDKVLLYGGEQWFNWVTTILDETWIYDFSDNNWTRMYPNTKPSARNGHSMSQIWGTDKILVFGNYDSSKRGETWVYDLSDNNWIKKNPDTVANFGGAHGIGLAPMYGTDEVFLFGGKYSANYYDDIWFYDLSEDNWKIQATSLKPSYRYFNSAAAFDKLRSIVIFGGMNEADYKNDTWIYNYSTYHKEGIFKSEPLDFGATSNFKNIQWNISPTFTGDIKFKIRTASSKTGLDSKSFFGPDGTTGTYYKKSPSNIWQGHNGDKWVQFMAFFNSNNSHYNLFLHNVTINYNNLPNTILTKPENNAFSNQNNPLFEWNISDLDSSNQSGFQVLIDDENTFDSIDFDSGEQSSIPSKWQFPDGTSYTKIPDGKWYWKVRVKDNDGDWGLYSTPFIIIIDTGIPSSTISTPMKDKYYSGLNEITGYSLDNNEGSGISKTEISLIRSNDNNYWNGSEWVSEENWLITSGIVDWTFDSSSVNWTTGVDYKVLSRAIDNASNHEIVTSSIKFSIDMEGPISVIENPRNKMFTNNLETILGIASDSGGSDLEKVEISIKRQDDNMYWSGISWEPSQQWLATEGIDPWSYKTNKQMWRSDTTYSVFSRATDNAGNVEPQIIECTFLYDDKPPENLSIIINDDEKYTNSTTVKLSLKATDSGCGLSNMSFSKDNSLWSIKEQFNQTTSYLLNSGDGEKTIYYKVEDHAGNAAEPVFDNIILDTKPPKQLTLTINNGESKTSSVIVTLNLSAFDELSGVQSMSFSDDGLYWSGWQEYKASTPYRIPHGDGTKTVYFRVRDFAGNIAEPIYTTIILNTSTSDKPGDNGDPKPNGDNGNANGSDKSKDISEKKGMDKNLLIIIIIVIIVVIIALMIFLVRRKKPSEAETETVKTDEERLSTEATPEISGDTPIPQPIPIDQTQTTTIVEPTPAPQPVQEITPSSPRADPQIVTTPQPLPVVSSPTPITDPQHLATSQPVTATTIKTPTVESQSVTTPQPVITTITQTPSVEPQDAAQPQLVSSQEVPTPESLQPIPTIVQTEQNSTTVAEESTTDENQDSKSDNNQSKKETEDLDENNE